jgi:hypothetical protein
MYYYFKFCIALVSILSNNHFCDKNNTKIVSQLLSLSWALVRIGDSSRVAVGAVGIANNANTSVEELPLFL